MIPFSDAKESVWAREIPVPNLVFEKPLLIPVPDLVIPHEERLKLTLKVKRPLSSSLCRGLAEPFAVAANDLWGNSMVVGRALEPVEAGDICTVELGEEPEDLGKLTGMTGTAMINDLEYRFAIKDFNIKTENYGGCPNREITLTGIL